MLKFLKEFDLLLNKNELKHLRKLENFNILMFKHFNEYFIGESSLLFQYIISKYFIQMQGSSQNLFTGGPSGSQGGKPNIKLF